MSEQKHERDFLEFLKDPSFDVNSRLSGGYRETILHRECWGGDLEIIKLLLAHPRIDVNSRDDVGNTPLEWACQRGNVETVKLMLKDKRVIIDSENTVYHTPFWEACLHGKFLVVEFLLLLENHQIKLTKSDVVSDVWNHSTPAEIAYMTENREIYNLVSEFEKDYKMAQRDLIKSKGLGQKFDAAQVFLMGLLYQEGYYRVEGANQSFFWILKELPTELKMIICNRSFGLEKDFIPSFLVLQELKVMKNKEILK